MFPCKIIEEESDVLEEAQKQVIFANFGNTVKLECGQDWGCSINVNFYTNAIDLPTYIVLFT